MSDVRHLLLSVPADWSNDAKGSFYEEFIVEILKPMRLRAERRLRVTGMELDILAKGEDRPATILVECKAHRDPISADVITKLMGNVHFRRADQGWLFTTSDLTKDGRGLWEEIQNDPEHARKFVWYSPARTIEVLVSQRSVVDPCTILHRLEGQDVGDWSLVIIPGRHSWLVELLEDGIPARYSVFDAKSGQPLTQKDAVEIAQAAPRYAALQVLQLSAEAQKPSIPVTRAPVARVIAGDAWDDPRPARPVDFVGRDDVIKSISAFIEQARTGGTSTRSFSFLAPSGWGKSSLALKLAKKAGSSGLGNVSITAVDSRSANNAAFVAEALRLSLTDALSHGSISKKAPLRIHSLREPLDSPDVTRALDRLHCDGKIAVLLFDQFEELFAKESLFEVFNAVRDLTLDIDSAQVPLVLGFAWKTDVSLPQQHPAYHLWHQLADRRKTFKVGEFKRGEIERVVSKAEKAIGKKLSRPVRSRLAEQCQGLPWLLKKLLVHVLQRVSTPESQYLLLERELDIEQLFKEDLEQLKDEHLRCLKFVATKAPVPVAEVEESFSRDTTNLLINQHLLVRSGMNYVIYWDIFRDYLIEERVPHIPWTRTFQRMPPVAARALEVLKEGSLTASGLAIQLSLKEGPTFNLLGDLVALQLVDTYGAGNYRLPGYLADLSTTAVAAVARNQLSRHVVTRAIERLWAKDQIVSYEAWIQFFDEQQPRNAVFSEATLRQYAANLKSWLLFAGLLELRPRGICRADGSGAQMGVLAAGKASGGYFLGGASPARLQQLLKKLFVVGDVGRSALEAEHLRNAITDASALNLIEINSDCVALRKKPSVEAELTVLAKAAILRQPTVKLAIESLRLASGDRELAGAMLAEGIGAAWKSTSAMRVLGGLTRYATWANDSPIPSAGSEQQKLQF